MRPPLPQLVMSQTTSTLQPLQILPSPRKQNVDVPPPPLPARPAEAKPRIRKVHKAKSMDPGGSENKFDIINDYAASSIPPPPPLPERPPEIVTKKRARKRPISSFSTSCDTSEFDQAEFAEEVEVE